MMAFSSQAQFDVLKQSRHMFIAECPTDEQFSEYKRWHAQLFPEVARGLRAAGVTQLTIWNPPKTRTLLMYIATAGPIDLAAATGPDSVESGYRSNPRAKEWEELMLNFHDGWVACDEIHSSDVQWT
jgi:L-rhamnose mutarotase